MLQRLALVVAATGFLELVAPAAHAKQEAGKTALDPNEKICEDIIPTGSRLGVKRICATRAEWADKRRQDRDAIDRGQVSPCMIQTTGARGHPGC